MMPCFARSSTRDEFDDRPGPPDPGETLRRLRAVLDGDELVHALDRLNRQPVSRLGR